MTGDSYVATEAADCRDRCDRSVFELVQVTGQPVLAGSVAGEPIDSFFDDVDGAGFSGDDADEHADDIDIDDADLAAWIQDGLDRHRWEQECRR